MKLERMKIKMDDFLLKNVERSILHFYNTFSREHPEISIHTMLTNKNFRTELAKACLKCVAEYLDN